MSNPDRGVNGLPTTAPGEQMKGRNSTMQPLMSALSKHTSGSIVQLFL
jgi:hypothetical protein